MLIRVWLAQLFNIKHYLIASLLIFIAGLLLGYTDSSSYDKLIQAQLEHMQGLVDKLKQSEHLQWSMFSHIILNNLQAALLAILFGIFFGVIPIFMLVSNGLLIGYMAANRPEGETIFYFLKGIWLHGIIEIPAFLLACALGIRLGFLIIEGFGSVFSIERRTRYQIKFREFIKLLVPMMILIAGCMVLAAIIESTISFSLMK